MSIVVAVIQKGNYLQVRIMERCFVNHDHTIGMHLPVQISQGLGISHSKTMPAITASVHIRTTMPMTITPTLCKVLSASWWRKIRIEHFDMLRASTKSTVDMKTFIWICSMSIDLRRHCRFPRPESTAVEMMTVAPMPHNEAPTIITSSGSGR